MTRHAMPWERPPEFTPDGDVALALRRAWSVVRLTQLQELTREVILQLGGLAPKDLLGYEMETPEWGPSGPFALALDVCSEELRRESGLPGADASSDVAIRREREALTHESASWVATFQAALLGYRRVACRLVTAACDDTRRA